MIASSGLSTQVHRYVYLHTQMFIYHTPQQREGEWEKEEEKGRGGGRGRGRLAGGEDHNRGIADPTNGVLLGSPIVGMFVQGDRRLLFPREPENLGTNVSRKLSINQH